MNNTIELQYQQTGTSSNTNELGMREMQRIAYAAKEEQYILLKSPPASGKSRALMFLALDKTKHQGLKKCLVAVPEKSIGRSFKNTDLTSHGFFADWYVSFKDNLCNEGTEGKKRETLISFLKDTSPERANLICTHTSLRNALANIDISLLNDCVLAIDEFHHASAETNNILGDWIPKLMMETNAHIIAMTGTYFRGDAVPVLLPEVEAMFTPITYNYYQQLNGYKYLKNLGINFAFYTGAYTDSIHEKLDLNKKTLIHIPSVNSRASTGDKYDEVTGIIECIGEIIDKDETHNLYTVKTNAGKILRVGDLVEDDPRDRQRLQSYLQQLKSKDDIDIIIALGTAKEGFDWEWCEQCLTVGVRRSLTEIIQILGRCTRDCEGKERADFINLIACPEASQERVEVAVNDMLKAISASLLMEQVLAPCWKFRTRKEQVDEPTGSNGQEGTNITIGGLMEPPSERAKQIVSSDMTELTASILQSNLIEHAFNHEIAPEIINKVLIPQIIEEKYNDVTNEDIEYIRQHVVSTLNIKPNPDPGGKGAGEGFVQLGKQFINIDELHINLIDKVNPFQQAYEILSKNVTAETLGAIQEVIHSKRITMTDAEAVELFNEYIVPYINKEGKKPTIHDSDPFVRRMAEALLYIQTKKQQHISQQHA
ncbi:MAG: DEAD/DEAH box helicase family protein [Rikenellaceae bacterium]